MAYLRIKGIVIKQVVFGEADLIITVLTSTRGKITAFAKNAKRPRSRLSAGAQLLCYSDFVLFKGRDIYSVNSCEVIEPFYNIRNDIIKLTYAAHMLDIINDSVQENQPANKVLQLFLNSLHMIANTDKSPELVVRIFELRLLTILGYAPHVKNCIVCGGDFKEGCNFSFNKCGFICKNATCITEDKSALDIMKGTARTINHIVLAPIKELFNFDVSPEVLKELKIVSSKYLRDRLEKDYTKLDFLKIL
ncbi:MAG TPA: DNA repair protein RecO [Clostridiaceae bacterium]|nr:DNA repair protein RecO [Clostridiaceae bacterium]